MKLNSRVLTLVFSVVMLLPLGALIYFNRTPAPDVLPVLILNDTALAVDAPYFLEDRRVFIKTAVLEALDIPYTLNASQRTLMLPIASGSVVFEDGPVTEQILSQAEHVSFPLKGLNDGWYIELERLEDWLGLRSTLMSDQKGLLLDSGDNRIWGIVSPQGSPLYPEPGGKGKRGRDLIEGERVRLFSDNGTEYRLRTQDGQIGYGRKSGIISYQETLTGQQKFTQTRKTPRQYGPINITFEYVDQYSRNPDLAAETKVEGLDVLCPTWFSLDEEAAVTNDASIRYTRDAHALGYRVWGVFRNGFEPERTHQLLSSDALKARAIASIAFYTAFYELDGINIDFENVYLEDRAPLVDFLKQLDAVLTRQGVSLSVDAAPPWGSDQWSLFLDRSALARIADYIILMAYDEHYADSPVSGPVASLGWTEKAVAESLKLIPAEKLVMAVPLYTRVWTETADGAGGISVSSKAIGMKDQEEVILGKDPVYVFDEKAGQMTVSYEEDGAMKRIWLEDEASMKARLQLIKKYDLAGLASWRRGFETENFWTLVRENMKGL